MRVLKNCERSESSLNTTATSSTMSTINKAKENLRTRERELLWLDKRNPFIEIPEAWITSLDRIEPHYCSVMKLHPGSIIPYFI